VQSLDASVKYAMATTISRSLPVRGGDDEDSGSDDEGM
jgi:hypothetical protein